jgi:hypothetical protein
VSKALLSASLRQRPTCSVLSLVNDIVLSSPSTVTSIGMNTPRYFSKKTNSLVHSAESRSSFAKISSASVFWLTKLETSPRG